MLRRRQTRFGHAAAALLLAVFLIPAHARAESGDGVFLLGEKGLACIRNADGAPDPSYRSCLHIGPVHVGQSMRDIAMMFGKAAREVRQGDVVLRVWPVQRGEPEGVSVPYWVIGFDAGQTVVSIQLTGPRPVDEYDFSGLRLADTEAQMIQILGSPVETHEVPGIGAVMLGWRPYPISVEIKDGRVFSIRISEAIGR